MHDAVVRVIKNGERAPEEERNAKARATAIREIEAYLAILDKHLGGKPYILGESFSLVDCATASFLPLLTRLGVDTNPCANVVKWSGTCMTRPALGRAMQG